MNKEKKNKSKKISYQRITREKKKFAQERNRKGFYNSRFHLLRCKIFFILYQNFPFFKT